ncbi:hypothetical protein O9H85_14865 [Paenibacillus filicis]|uniref:Uncharacterized protein n=1 Tax=Paenibacillus gyeongsangnamensis TaxID=3388067 RepID=A0ABT4Q9Y1_9BACL|nr:hypothetical protein [Paenibacillus filicis]MCZ8513692.1 hypothetical protein [Paenibacillus filicis]
MPDDYEVKDRVDEYQFSSENRNETEHIADLNHVTNDVSEMEQLSDFLFRL